VLDEHAELLAALKEQDPRKAAKAMQAHITAGHRDFKATFALEPRR
jgi:DNA-binding GntR family transcriptional regulator